MRDASSGDPGGGRGSGPDGRVWYASYGSNMHLDRLAHYIEGGRPPGAARSYPGCRDRRAPAASVPVELRGALYFATRSPVWRGGRAFYDPGAAGRVLARAHLVSAGQFADIAAQEMYHEPGADLDLGEVLSEGRSVLGAGRYETLICAGSLDGRPVLTFTAPWTVGDVTPTAPSAAYLRHLAQGLLESGAWNEATVTAYLAGCPGTAGLWTEGAIAELLRERDADPSSAGPRAPTPLIDGSLDGREAAVVAPGSASVPWKPGGDHGADHSFEGDIDDGDLAG